MPEKQKNQEPVYKNRHGKEITAGFYLDEHHQVCYAIPLSGDRLLIRYDLSSDPNEINKFNKTFTLKSYINESYISNLKPINPLDHLEKLVNQTHFILAQLNNLERLARENLKLSLEETAQEQHNSQKQAYPDDNVSPHKLESHLPTLSEQDQVTFGSYKPGNTPKTISVPPIHQDRE